VIHRHVCVTAAEVCDEVVCELCECLKAIWTLFSGSKVGASALSGPGGAVNHRHESFREPLSGAIQRDGAKQAFLNVSRSLMISFTCAPPLIFTLPQLLIHSFTTAGTEATAVNTNRAQNPRVWRSRESMCVCVCVCVQLPYLCVTVIWRESTLLKSLG